MIVIHSAQPPLKVVVFSEFIFTTLNTSENAVCSYFQSKYNKSVRGNSKCDSEKKKGEDNTVDSRG